MPFPLPLIADLIQCLDGMTVLHLEASTTDLRRAVGQCRLQLLQKAYTVRHRGSWTLAEDVSGVWCLLCLADLPNLPTCSVEMEVGFVFRTRSTLLHFCRQLDSLAASHVRLEADIYNMTRGDPKLQVKTTYTHTLFSFEKLYNHPGVEVYYSATPHTDRPELWQTATLKAHFMKRNGPQKMKFILCVEMPWHNRVLRRYITEDGGLEAAAAHCPICVQVQCVLDQNIRLSAGEPPNDYCFVDCGSRAVDLMERNRPVPFLVGITQPTGQMK